MEKDVKQMPARKTATLLVESKLVRLHVVDRVRLVVLLLVVVNIYRVRLLHLRTAKLAASMARRPELARLEVNNNNRSPGARPRTSSIEYRTGCCLHVLASVWLHFFFFAQQRNSNGGRSERYRYAPHSHARLPVPVCTRNLLAPSANHRLHPAVCVCERVRVCVLIAKKSTENRTPLMMGSPTERCCHASVASTT